MQAGRQANKRDPPEARVGAIKSARVVFGLSQGTLAPIAMARNGRLSTLLGWKGGSRRAHRCREPEKCLYSACGDAGDARVGVRKLGSLQVHIQEGCIGTSGRLVGVHTLIIIDPTYLRLPSGRKRWGLVLGANVVLQCWRLMLGRRTGPTTEEISERGLGWIGEGDYKARGTRDTPLPHRAKMGPGGGGTWRD